MSPARMRVAGWGLNSMEPTWRLFATTITSYFLRSAELIRFLPLSPDSRLNGKNLINSEIRKKYDVIVVAIKRQDGSMLFNPKPGTVILAGDILIVLGASEQIAGLGREM